SRNGGDVLRGQGGQWAPGGSLFPALWTLEPLNLHRRGDLACRLARGVLDLHDEIHDIRMRHPDGVRVLPLLYRDACLLRWRMVRIKSIHLRLTPPEALTRSGRRQGLRG